MRPSYWGLEFGRSSGWWPRIGAGRPWLGLGSSGQTVEQPAGGGRGGPDRDGAARTTTGLRVVVRAARCSSSSELFRALWSEAVNREWMASLARDRPDLSVAAIARVRDLYGGARRARGRTRLRAPDRHRHVAGPGRPPCPRGGNSRRSERHRDGQSQGFSARGPCAIQHGGRGSPMPSFAVSSRPIRMRPPRHSLPTARGCAIPP